jgi:hypothetical protein
MIDPVLEALWKKVLDDFDNDRAHGAFIEHCQTTGQLLEAAVRYRGMAGDHLRGPIAEKRLAGIAVLALAGLESERTPERPGLTVLVRLLLIFLFVAGTVVLLVAALR